MREEEAAILHELIESPHVLDYVENMFYATELTDQADPPGAISISSKVQAMPVVDFMHRLILRQSEIESVRVSWEAIPDESFATLEARRRFHGVAIREGLFKKFAGALANDDSIDEFLLNSLFNSSISELANHRDVMQSWTSGHRFIYKRDPVSADEP